MFTVRTSARSGALIISAFAIVAACGGSATQAPTQAAGQPTQAAGQPTQAAGQPTQAAGQPTQAGGLPTTAAAGGGDCALISAAKVTSIVGSTMTVQDSKPDNCTFLGDFTSQSGFGGLNVRTGSGETISAAKTVWGGGQDLTVAGHPAYWAPGVTALYVDLGGGNSMVVQIVGGDATKDLDVAQKIAVAMIGG